MEQPLAGPYEFTDVNEPIVVHQGQIRVDGESCDGRIAVRFDDDLAVRWEGLPEDAWAFRDLGPVALTIERPDLGQVSIPAIVMHSDGKGEVVEAVELGGDKTMRSVRALMMNCPPILPVEPLEDAGRVWAGRWTCQAAGWAVTLDVRPDHAEAMREAWGRRAFVPTHVLQVKRVDGSDFDTEAATSVLFGLQMALSFALGRWVAPVLPVGFDASGARVWEQLAPWRCDPMRGSDSWWDTHTGNDLRDFVRAYLEAWNTPDQPVVRHVAFHAIAANHSGTTTEARLMLVQAGLEYLAWNDFVLTGDVTEQQYSTKPFSHWLSKLLQRSGIPADIPTELQAVLSLSTSKKLNGPEALTWIRNRLVHPKSASEPYKIEGLIWQSLFLSLQHLELLLLHRLGYGGMFKRRYPPGRFAHERETVPWAT